MVRVASESTTTDITIRELRENMEADHLVRDLIHKLDIADGAFQRSWKFK